MYCKHCANPLDDMAAICVKCGAPKGQGANYCPNCAAQTVPGAVVCVNCGVALAQPVQGEQKSKVVAGILGILLGSLGIHNFYLGYTTKALIQLLVSVLLSWTVIAPTAMAVWGLIEGIMILTGSINKDAKGIPLKD